MDSWEEYLEQAEKAADESIASLHRYREEQKKLPKEKRKKSRRHAEPKDYESDDSVIYAVEHGHAYDGFYDCAGYSIGEDWERYKVSIGYYERHPEEEEYSKAFTRQVMEWRRKNG